MGKTLNYLLQWINFKGSRCIEWPYSRTYDYGQLTGGTYRRANREMCLRTHGPPPFPEAEAIHSCGNKPCINPNHIRWGTAKENSNERKSNKFIEIDGQIKTLKQWTELYEIDYMLVYNRLKNNWSIYSALTTPIRGRKYEDYSIKLLEEKKANGPTI